MNSNLDANASHLSKAEKDLENALRPDMFDSFAGQKQVVDNLRVFVKAAAQRGEALDHTLLYGPSRHEDDLGTRSRQAGQPCGSAYQP